jgi:NADH-quinone oxidoreductase subunit E
VVQLATFYKTFSVTPRGRTAVNVCCGASCHVRGATRIVDRVRDTIGIGPGETDGDSRFSFETGSCQGCCSLGPELIVDGKHHGRISPDEAEGVLKNH